MKHISNLILLAFCLLAATACGKKEAETRHLESQKEKTPYVGALTPVVEGLKKQSGIGSCDQRLLPHMLEIAKALDDRGSEITDYARSLPTKENFRKVKLGPIFVNEPLTPSKVPAAGWQTFDYSWDQSIALYRKALASPTIENWYNLDADVRGIIVDDVDRFKYPGFYSTGHADEGILRSLLSKSGQCLGKTGCIQPGFSPEEVQWLKGKALYAPLIEKILTSKNHSTTQEVLRDLTPLLDDALVAFEFRINPDIRRTGNELILSLYAGDFSEVAEALANYIEPFWQSADLRLKIEWVKDQARNLFVVFAQTAPSGRSFVSYKLRGIYFANNTRPRTLGHEIGHVLGFRDLYYTLWDESGCRYITEHREDDLMSSGFTPTAEEWKKLKESY